MSFLIFFYYYSLPDKPAVQIKEVTRLLVHRESKVVVGGV